MKILILCPLKSEAKALRGSLAALGLDAETITRQGRSWVQNEQTQFILAAGGLGAEKFEKSTRHYLQQFPSLKTLIIAGGAGILDPSLKILQVIAAESIVDATSKDVYRTDPGLLAMLAEDKVCRGGILSMDENILDRNRAQTIFQKTSCRAVAWEGAAGARVAKQANLGFLELRALTDTADIDAARQFSDHLALAMEALAKAIHPLIK